VLQATLSPALCTIIAALVGLLLGLDSPQQMPSDQDRLAAMFGNSVSLYLLMLYPMALADRFNTLTWQKIGVRVLASWVAASALLVLALSLVPVAA
jgi:hypothetical protein